MYKISQLLTTFPLWILLLGCQTSPPLDSPIVTEERKQPELVLESEIRGSDKLIPDEGCVLWVENLADKTAQSIRIPKTNGFVRAELPPGRYQSTKLTCTLLHTWELPNLFAQGLNLESDRLHFAGRFVFEFTDQDLKSVKLASRQEVKNSLGFLFKQLGPYDADSLVSAYTNRPILKEMLTGESEGIQLKVSGESSKFSRLLLSDLEICQQMAKKSDPLLIGSIKVSAKYRRQDLVSLEKQNEQNAFNQSFVSCVESVLTSKKAARGPASVEMVF